MLEAKEFILGVGFTRRTGLGYTMAISFAKAGAEVVVGGSSEGSVQGALRNLQRRDKVDPNLLSGFTADLRDFTQIDQAVTSLKKPPTIVIYAAARGMEGFFFDMNNYLLEMRRIKSNESDAEVKIADKKRELRKKLAIWLPQSYQDALAVNRTAPEYLIGRLVNRFAEQFRFVYINSSFGYEGNGPIHYTNVYQTKHQMSVWMTENAQRLATQGVDMHEEIDPVIFDTDVGESILETISPFWPPPMQRLIEETAVSRLDVFGSVKKFTDLTPNQRNNRPRPNRHFLLRRAGVAVILDSFPKELITKEGEFDF